MRYAVLFLLVATAAPLHAQTRATQIAAEFTKTKAQTKNKAGASTTKYREVRSEVWRVDNVHYYAGRYISLGDPLILEINFAPALSVHGSDSERFEILNPRFDGALLTGTKLYRDGRTEAFEAAFLERSATRFAG